MSGTNFPYALTDLPDERQHRKDIAEKLNNTIRGKLNCTVDVTLNPSATSTTVQDVRIGIKSHFTPCALTASASAAVASGLWYTPSKGQVVISHASSAATDQTIRLSILA